MEGKEGGEGKGREGKRRGRQRREGTRGANPPQIFWRVNRRCMYTLTDRLADGVDTNECSGALAVSLRVT